MIIVGRSGSGKSTVLNIAAGLTKPTSGRVMLDGKYLDTLTDRKLSRLRSHKIGFVFQFTSLLPTLNIVENVLTPIMFNPVLDSNSADKRARELLEMLGLGERLDCYPRHLSAGEQKRVVIARALMNKPPIILADEPTSDLDEQTERDIIALLEEIHASGVTILMVTHSLRLIPYANRAYKMENGNLELIGGE